MSSLKSILSHSTNPINWLSVQIIKSPISIFTESKSGQGLKKMFLHIISHTEKRLT